MALSTKFKFACEKWRDPESPLTYEFSYGAGQNQAIFAYRTSSSGTDADVTEWLAAGDKKNDYILTVQFTIKDSLGSQATHYIEVKVWISFALQVQYIANVHVTKPRVLGTRLHVTMKVDKIWAIPVQ